MLRMRNTKLHADSRAMLLNYFRRKDAKDKGHFLPERRGELPKEVVERKLLHQAWL